MLWSGFLEVPEIGMNVFVLERPPLACGDRIVQIQGVVEQQGGPGSYSELTVETQPDGVRSHIRANVSEADQAVLDAARVELRRWAEQLAGGTVVEIVRHGSPGSSAARDGRDAPWFGHDDALNAVTETDVAGAFAQFDVPYGAFEHEACTHPIGDGGPVPVSSDLEVVELPGVYVAGPGAFARLGAANPALTIIAMSRWLGERLSGG
jgi:choline dehydrogenase-like flavoprotein